MVRLKEKQIFFSQGDSANSIFYMQAGSAKLTVVSKNGKEATITLLTTGDFVGEESLLAIAGLRVATASAITACSVLRISKERMRRVIHDESTFSDAFLECILKRSMRVQDDLIAHLFNNSEKRLAQLLLTMADAGRPEDHQRTIQALTHEDLAHLVGTTRSRVTFFMNRFRKLGFIRYNERIFVHKLLLSTVLND